MTEKSGPLAGIRLLEIDAIGPVPLAAMLLADMGAEIVRIAKLTFDNFGEYEEPSDAEYEALVRQQLTELGYNSDAIPDEVLREFLADFEEKMELGEADPSPSSAAGTASLREASPRGLRVQPPLSLSHL